MKRGGGGPAGLEDLEGDFAGGDSDGDFDFGDSDDELSPPTAEGTAAALGSSFVVAVYGSGSADPVRFPAVASPYLAELIASEPPPAGEKRHTMLATRGGLQLCLRYYEARAAARRRRDDASVASANSSNGLLSAVLRDAGDRVPKLMEAARAAHLLKMSEFFELLAEKFGQHIRDADILPRGPLQHEQIQPVMNKLRDLFGLKPTSLSALGKEHLKALELFFSAPSMAGGLGTISTVGGDRRPANQTVDVGGLQLRLKHSPFGTVEWQDDNAVSKCPDCRRDFTAYWQLTSMVTRSHCRVCGLVKCKQCVSETPDPRYAKAYKPTDDPNNLKCCKACKDATAHHSNGTFLTRLLIGSRLNVVQLAALQLVDPDFVAAVHMALYEVRQAFTSFCDSELTHDQIRLILSSRELCAGHLQWVLAVFHCTDWAVPSEGAAALAVFEKTLALLTPAVVASPDDDDGATARSTVAATPEYSHFQLMCTRACAEPMFHHYALEFLRCINGINDNVGGGYVGTARRQAARLLLHSVETPAMKRACVPVVLDLLHLQPSPAGVEEVRYITRHLCLNDGTTSMQVFSDTTARLKFGDTVMQRTLEYIRSDVAEVGTFAAEQLHNVNALVDCLDTATSLAAAGTEIDARRALFTTLQRFSLVMDEAVATGSSPAGAPGGGVANASITSVGGGARSRATSRHGTAAAATGGGGLDASPSLVPNRVDVIPTPYLFDPEYTIVGIDLARLRVMPSKVRPWHIRFFVRRSDAMSDTAHSATDEGGDADGSARESRARSPSPAPPGGFEAPSSRRPGEEEVAILYKREDVRQDYVVCNVFKALNEFFVRRRLLDAPVATYGVLPTGPDRGIIQFVPSADSVQAQCVDSSSSATPMATWLDHQQMTPAMVNDRTRWAGFKGMFLSSARFYTLATFVLGIGDRHRGNVLLCRDTGSICHIDFGFVLGAMTAAESMTTKFVRYDDDLRKAIESHYPIKQVRDAGAYGRAASFLDDTADMLLALRPHHGFVRLLLDHWVIHGMHSGAKINDFLADRFFLSLSDAEAREKLTQLIVSSFGQNWLQDWTHLWALTLKQSSWFGGGSSTGSGASP